MTAQLQLVPRPPSDDAGLLRALLAKERHAARELYLRARPGVSRTILRLLRSTDEHDELVQLAMIELVLGIERFKGQCSLDSWISIVTAHVVFKHLRSRRRERLVFSALGDDDGPAYSVPAPASTGGLVITRDLLRRLATLLRSVDDSKAEVFVLHDVHGYELKEVAEILGLTVANAQSRLVRGRKQLHELIREDPELKNALDELRGVS